jgi:hypothetical protein
MTMITLYLFTTFGIFVWDKYPSYEECSEVHVEIALWFDMTSNTQSLYSIECIGIDQEPNK